MSKYAAGHKSVNLAAEKSVVSILGHCVVNIELENNKYSAVKLQVLPSLCADIIFGVDFMEQYRSVQIILGGMGPVLVINGNQ